MFECKKICCAIDFGNPSRAAMEQAAELAKRFDAELTLLHVLVPQLAAASDVLVSSRGIAALDAEQAQGLLAGWCADAEGRAGRAVRSRLLWGDPAAEVVRHVRDERCDLLVVGTHGRGGVARLLLGSVAEHIARRSPCPVLVARDTGVLEETEVAEEVAQYR
jgi:nucleotide-binding universal stress UspA family protein